MALLRKNQPAIVILVNAAPSFVKSYIAPDLIHITNNRREALQATWRALREIRGACPGATFKSDLDPNA